MLIVRPTWLFQHRGEPHYWRLTPPTDFDNHMMKAASMNVALIATDAPLIATFVPAGTDRAAAASVAAQPTAPAKLRDWPGPHWAMPRCPIQYWASRLPPCQPLISPMPDGVVATPLMLTVPPPPPGLPPPPMPPPRRPPPPPPLRAQTVLPPPPPLLSPQPPPLQSQTVLPPPPPLPCDLAQNVRMPDGVVAQQLNSKLPGIKVHVMQSQTVRWFPNARRLWKKRMSPIVSEDFECSRDGLGPDLCKN
jgi:hypothetical protein